MDERIESLNKGLSHKWKLDGPPMCTFREMVVLQAELCLDAEFQHKFVKKLLSVSMSVEQILHHMEDIVILLVQGVLDTAYAAQVKLAIMEIIVALCWEVKKEFYVYMVRVVKGLIESMEENEYPEYTARVLECVAQIFRKYQITIAKDSARLESFYAPLLGNRKVFIREFAARTLAPIMRKIMHDDKMFLDGFLVALVTGDGLQDEYLCDGVTRCVFHLMKNVGQHFHSKMDVYYASLLNCPSQTLRKDQTDGIRRIVMGTTTKMMQYTSKDKMEHVWTIIGGVIKTTGDMVQPVDHEKLAALYDVLTAWIDYKKGVFVNVQHLNDLSEVIITALHNLEYKSAKPGIKRAVHNLALSFLRRCFKDTNSAIFPVCRKLVLCITHADTVSLPLTTQFIHNFLPIVNTQECEDYYFQVILEFLYSNMHKLGLLDILKLKYAVLQKHQDNKKLRQLMEQDYIPSFMSCFTKALLGDESDDDVKWTAMNCVSMMNYLPGRPIVQILEKCQKHCNRTQSQSLLAIKASMVAQFFRKRSKMDDISYDEAILQLQEKTTSYIHNERFLQHLALYSNDKSKLTATQLRQIFDMLQENMTSPSTIMRKITLEILSYYPRQYYANVSGDSNSFEGICPAFDLCLEISNINVSIETEREVIRRLENLVTISKSSKMPTLYREIVLQAMFGLLHVKYQRLWAPVEKVVQALSSVEFNTIWPYIRKLMCDLDAFIPKDITKNPISTVETWDNALFIESVNMGRDESSTDFKTLHSSVWNCIVKIGSQIELKSMIVVPMFYSFLLREVYSHMMVQAYDNDRPSKKMLRGSITDAISKLRLKKNGFESDASVVAQFLSFTSGANLNLNYSTTRQKLVSYLRLFASFTNFPGSYANDITFAIMFYLLNQTDSAISKLALKCIGAYKLPYIQPYMENLHNLIDETTYRDTMTNFDISPSGGVILTDHRTQFCPVLIRILYGKFMTRKGKSSKDTLAIRRTSILAYLSSCRDEELAYFIQLILKPFHQDVKVTERLCSDDVEEYLSKLNCSSVPVSVQLGFLNLLQSVFAQLGIKITVYLSQLVGVLTAMLESTAKPLQSVDVGSATTWPKKEIKALCYKRLSELIALFVDADQTEVAYEAILPFMSTFWKSQKGPIEHVATSMMGANHSSALLKLCIMLTKLPNCKRLFYKAECLSVQAYVPLDHILKCLVAKNVNLEIVEEVLSMINSLISIDLQSGDSKNWSNMMIINKLPDLISLFLQRLTIKDIQGTNNSLNRRLMARNECMVLCRMTKLLGTQIKHFGKLDPSLAQNLFTLLLPYLVRGREVSSEDKVHILQSISSLFWAVPCVPPQIALRDKATNVRELSNLLVPAMNGLGTRYERKAVVDVLDALAHHYADDVFAQGVQLLRQMHAYHSRRIQEEDIERRLDAYVRLRESLLQQYLHHEIALIPILSQVLASLRHEDYAIRTASRGILDSLFQLLLSDDFCSLAMPYVLTLVLPNLKSGLKTRDPAIRREYIVLLGIYARLNSPSFIEKHGSRFPHLDLRLLIDDNDPELDFFSNIIHVQTHRRGRAIKRVRESLNSGCLKLTVSTTKSIMLPIIEHFLFEHDSQQKQHLTNEAANIMGTFAKVLAWTPYLHCLQNLIRQVPQYPQSESTIVHAICSVVREFHFNLLDENIQIRDVLLDRVVPALKKLLSKQTGQKQAVNDGEMSIDMDSQILRAPIALALVKLLRFLPQSYFNSQFPKFLMEIVKFLKMKNESGRKSARETLAQIAVELGPKFLSAMIRELEHIKRGGNSSKVISYSVHTILEKIVPCCRPVAPFPLQDNIEKEELKNQQLSAFQQFIIDEETTSSVMAIAIEDLVADAKQLSGSSEGTRYISKMKEANICKSFDTIELLAQGISFLPCASIYTIVHSVLQLLNGSDCTRLVSKVRESLRRIGVGLSKNSSVDAGHLLYYVFTLMQFIEESMPPAKDSSKNVKTASVWLTKFNASSKSLKRKVFLKQLAWNTFKVHPQPKMTGFDRLESQRTKDSFVSVNECTIFALQLLNSAFKRKIIQLKTSENHSPLVVPLIPKILSYLATSSNNQIILNCLKVLYHCSRGDMISFPMDKFIDLTLHHLFHAAKSKSLKNEILQQCFRCITSILREKTTFTFSSGQITAILGYVQSFSSEPCLQNVSFALLKAILFRKIVCIEVYDLMETIGVNLVQGHSETARASCGQLYLQFLLDYPLGEKRLHKHIDFLMKNLSYEFEEGRVATLNCLYALLVRLPDEMINARPEYFFLPLVLRLANDSSSKCRESVANTMRLLMKKKFSSSSMNKCTVLLNSWWTSDELRAVAAQVFGFIVEVNSKFAASHNHFAIRQIAEILSNFSEVSEQDSTDNESEIFLHATAWKQKFYALNCLEKIIAADLFALVDMKVAECIIPYVVNCLVYPHTWIRLAANKVLSCYLRDISPNEILKSKNYFNSRDRLFQYASKLCQQLQSEHCQEEIASFVISGVVFVVSVLVNIEPSYKLSIQAGSKLCMNEQDNAKHSNPVDWIFTRMSHLGRSPAAPITQCTVFKFFAAMITKSNGQEWCSNYLIHMINPLFRVVSQADDAKRMLGSRKHAMTNADKEVVALAREVLSMMETTFDSSMYLEKYQFVQKQVQSFRRTRHLQRQAESVANPEGFAVRKIRKNKSKQLAKQKRKIHHALTKGKRIKKTTNVAGTV